MLNQYSYPSESRLYIVGQSRLEASSYSLRHISVRDDSCDDL